MHWNTKAGDIAEGILCATLIFTVDIDGSIRSELVCNMNYRSSVLKGMSIIDDDKFSFELSYGGTSTYGTMGNSIYGG